METEQYTEQVVIPIKRTGLFHMKHPGNCPGKVSYAEYQGYKIKVHEYDISYGATVTTPMGEDFYITQAYYHTLKRFAFQILKNRIRKFILEDMFDN